VKQKCIAQCLVKALGPWQAWEAYRLQPLNQSSFYAILFQELIIAPFLNHPRGKDGHCLFSCLFQLLLLRLQLY